jgi:hypothetical protein
MNGLPWFRWTPGGIPQLERVSPSVRGLSHALMDWIWQNMEDNSSTSEILSGLMLDYSDSDIVTLNRVRPFLENYLDSEWKFASSSREKKRESGRVGGLARASNAKRCLNVPSDALSAQAPTYLPTEIPTPLRKRKGNAIGEGFDLVEIAMQNHPKRKSQSGEPIAKGSRAAAAPKLMEKVKKFNLTQEDIADIGKAYQVHPNVAQGYVQALEVFWNEGRWYDCWQTVQYNRRKAEERATNVAGAQSL